MKMCGVDSDLLDQSFAQMRQQCGTAQIGV